MPSTVSVKFPPVRSCYSVMLLSIRRKKINYKKLFKFTNLSATRKRKRWVKSTITLINVTSKHRIIYFRINKVQTVNFVISVFT